MIIGTMGSMEDRKLRSMSAAQRKLYECVKFKMEELGMTRSDANYSCKDEMEGALGCIGCFGGPGLNPYRVMTTGRVPRWNRGNPRAALTGVLAFIRSQTHI